MKKKNKNIINIFIVWLFYKNCIKNVIKKLLWTVVSVDCSKVAKLHNVQLGIIILL